MSDSIFSKLFGGNQSSATVNQPADVSQLASSMPVSPSLGGPVDPVVSKPADPQPSVPQPVPQPPVFEPVSEPQAPIVPPEPEVPSVTTPQAPPVQEAPAPEVSDFPPVSQAQAIPIDEAYREKIIAQLTKTMLDSVEEKKLTEGEMSVISGYILDSIDNIKTHQDLTNFLYELSWRWPIFKQVLKVEKGVEKESKDDEKAETIQGLIKENKIEEAIDAAQSATSSVM